LANFMLGMPIDENKEMVGGFLQFLNPFALLGGVMFLLLTMVHGLQFITIRTVGELQERARKTAKIVAPLSLGFFLAFILLGFYLTDIFTFHGTWWIILPIGAWMSLMLASIFNSKQYDMRAFMFTSLTIVLLTASIFIGMFPRVMISSLADANSLTIYSAASGAYTLKVMTYFSLTLLPFVLGYQGWSYYVFRKRVTKNDELEY